MPPGQWSKAALQERHAAQAYKDTLLACARDYAVGHGLGAKAALNTGLFPGIGYTLLHKTIHGTSRLAKREQGMREAWQILTDVEELALVEWIISSGRGKDPPTDEDVGRQIILMLKARKHDNKQRKHGRGTVPLTTAETRLVTEANAEVSHIWLQKFAGRHPEVSKQKERNADASRTKKQNEGVVEKHFNGEFGVVESLKSIGNMNEDGSVKDPRRCLWFDEMPQAMDAANQGPRSKAWGASGEALERAGSVNRETGSVAVATSRKAHAGRPPASLRRRLCCSRWLFLCLCSPSQRLRSDSQRLRSERWPRGLEGVLWPLDFGLVVAVKRRCMGDFFCHVVTVGNGRVCSFFEFPMAGRPRAHHGQGILSRSQQGIAFRPAFTPPN